MSLRAAGCAAAGLVAALTLAACSATSSGAPRRATASSPARVSVSSSVDAAASHATPSSTPSPSPNRSSTTRTEHRPVIVIDPGHSRTIYAIDRQTGLNVSDYENEPEMRDVYAVAKLVEARLKAAGYRVVMTKKSLDERVSLGRRAAIANHAHAALALSIHDQAGPNGGIGFKAGNNTVYYQSVGDYRDTPAGKRVTFTNKRVAALSKKYGRIFRTQRSRTEHVHVRLQPDVGYNLASRGLPAGDIWLVQLLSHVPWIYNESGGNSAGRSGLDRADERTYARGLVAAVERCVPITH